MRRVYLDRASKKRTMSPSFNERTTYTCHSDPGERLTEYVEGDAYDLAIRTLRSIATTGGLSGKMAAETLTALKEEE